MNSMIINTIISQTIISIVIAGEWVRSNNGKTLTKQINA